MKKKKKVDLGFVFQFIFSFISLVLAVISLFHSSMLLYVELSVSVTMFLMAYNNERVYKRRNFTVLYGIVGIVLLGVCLFNLLGGR